MTTPNTPECASCNDTGWQPLTGTSAYGKCADCDTPPSDPVKPGKTLEQRVLMALKSACERPLTDYGEDQPYVTSQMVSQEAGGDLTVSQITPALKRLWAKGRVTHYSEWRNRRRWFLADN